MSWWRFLGYRIIGMAAVLAAVVAVPTIITFYEPGGEQTTLARQGTLHGAGLGLLLSQIGQAERSIPAAFNFPGHVFVNALVISLILVFGSILVGAIVAIPLGIYAAVYHKSWFRHVGTLGALTAQGIPTYVVAVGLQFIFAVLLKWFPLSGWNSPLSAVLPTVALAFGNVGYIAKFMQAGMTEVLQQPYIVSTRARGLHEWTVILRHAFRPAVLATVTFFGPQAAMLINQTLVLEAVFSLPGLAILLGGAMSALPGVAIPYGMTGNTTLAFFLLALLTLILNFLVDVSYRALNPEVAR